MAVASACLTPRRVPHSQRRRWSRCSLSGKLPPERSWSWMLPSATRGRHSTTSRLTGGCHGRGSGRPALVAVAERSGTTRQGKAWTTDGLFRETAGRAGARAGGG